MSAELDGERWRLLYFGHVDPALYGVDFEYPKRTPEFALYAVSVNYWKGMQYAVLNERGEPEYMLDDVAWLKSLIPTAQFGSLVLFDLRPATVDASKRASDHYNLGFVYYVRGEYPQAVERLKRAIELDPEFAEAYLALGNVYASIGNSAAACDALRSAVRLRGDWSEALNNLAWQLATTTDEQLRNPTEAVQLALCACQLSQPEPLSYLDTLIAAYAADGQLSEAIEVCRQAEAKAAASGASKLADGFRQTMRELESKRATRSQTPEKGR